MAKTAAKTSATKVKGARAGKTTRTPDARASTTSSAKPVRAATASGNVAAAKAGSPTVGANKPSQPSGSNKSAPKARATAPNAATAARPASKSSAGAVPAAKSAPLSAVKSSAGSIAAATKSSAGQVAAVAKPASKSSAGQVAAVAKPASKSSSGQVAAVAKPASKSSSGQVAAVAHSTQPIVREATANGIAAAKHRAEAPLVDVTPVSDVQAPATRAPDSKPDRSGPKGAANKNATIDTWAADKLDAAQKSVLDAIRKIVRRVAPQATEAVKWAQPVWERNGPFAFLKPAKNHVTFGFWRGTELPDPKGLLEGAGDRMRHLKIRLGASVPIEQIATFVREAVRRNEAKGDPTKPRS